MIFEAGKAEGFATPEAVARDGKQSQDWQKANRAWWEAHPMRYDWRKGIAESSEHEWFQEIDRRSFASHIVPQRHRPFDGLIPLEALPALDVLEIGVGMGTHAQLIAQRARTFTGIDVTAAAVTATRRRFSLFGLRGAILQMDAQDLAFPDASFDLVWSWGVVHHSADTRKVLEEIRRVLRPGGEARVMVYHKALVPWYFYDGFLRGVVEGRLFRHGSISTVVQSVTDGALARYYTKSSWIKATAGLFEVQQWGVYGNRAEALPIPAGTVKDWIAQRLPEQILSFYLTKLAQGRLLYSVLRPVRR